MILKKPYTNQEYREFANICNNQGLTIEDKGECFEAIKIEPNLDELKQQKIQHFKALRDNEEVAIIEYNNKFFDYDDKSRERMRIAEKALIDNNLPSQVWTCADNSSTELTIQDFKNINTLAAQRSGALHVKYNELKMQIAACATRAELEAISW